MAEQRQQPIGIDLIGPFSKRALLALALSFLAAFSESISFALVMPLLEVAMKGTSGSYFGAMLSPVIGRFENINIVIVLAIFIFGLFFLKNILIILRNACMYSMEWGLRSWWMHHFFDYYLRMDYAEYTGKKEGEIVNQITNETLKSAATVRQIVELISQIVLVCSLFAVLLISNYRITMAVILIAVLIFFFTKKIVQHYTMSVGQKRISFDQGILRTIVETLNGMQTVRAMVMERSLSSRFAKDLHPLVKMMGRSEVIRRIPTQISEIIFIVLIVAVLLWVEYLSGGELVDYLPFLGMFVIISTRLFSHIGALSSTFIAVKIHMPSVRMVADLMKETEKIGAENGGIVFERLTKDINISELCFEYEEKKRVLNSVNLDIPRGSMAGIIGPSGSGKSTLVKLLLGFYTPTKGHIYIDGVLLEDLDVRSWRSNIGYVSQESFFFNGTIYENLALVRPDVSMEAVEEALRKAECWDFVKEMTDGVHAKIGDKGLTLSGGQRTRLSFARAILAQPQVYLLDEVTSALDMETEQAIIHTIEKLRADATIIVVTHRLDVIKNADIVYKLNRGGNIERTDREE